MSKKSGLGAQGYVGGYDITNDIGQMDGMDESVSLLEVTGMDKSAVERVRGPKSGRFAFTGFFNDAALREHAALSGLPTTDVVCIFLTSSTLGDEGVGITGKQINYAWNRPADGSLGISAEVLGNGDGLNWGKSLTAGKKTDSAAANGTGVNFAEQPKGAATSSAFGLVAYLEVFAFTGTNVTVTIEESDDDGSGDAYAAVTGGVFTAASGITAERIETSLSLTVEQYLRAVTSGTFSNAVFAVVCKRYASANAERE